MSRRCIRPWVLDAVARMRSDREAAYQHYRLTQAKGRVAYEAVLTQGVGE